MTTAAAQGFATAPAGRGTAIALLLLGGWLGMHAGEVILAWRADGPAAVLASPAVGPLELMALWLSAEALWQGRAAPVPGLAWAVALPFALGMLLPSSLLPALLLIGFGLLLAAQRRGAARWGALGMAGLGLNLLWLRFGQPAIGAPIVTAEAWTIQGLLGLLEPGITRDGHLLRMPGDHAVIILPGCSFGQTLPVALLGFLLLRHGAGRQPPLRRTLAAMGLLVLALAAANLVRLGLLAWSPATYAWGHGAVGANLFGLAGVLLIHLAAEAWAAEAWTADG